MPLLRHGSRDSRQHCRCRLAPCGLARRENSGDGLPHLPTPATVGSIFTRLGKLLPNRLAMCRTTAKSQFTSSSPRTGRRPARVVASQPPSPALPCLGGPIKCRRRQGALALRPISLGDKLWEKHFRLPAVGTRRKRLCLPLTRQAFARAADSTVGRAPSAARGRALVAKGLRTNAAHHFASFRRWRGRGAGCRTWRWRAPLEQRLVGELAAMRTCPLADRLRPRPTSQAAQHMEQRSSRPQVA